MRRRKTKYVMNCQDSKQITEEYFEKLRKWLDDSRSWYSLSAWQSNASDASRSPINQESQFAGPANNSGVANENNQQAPNDNTNGVPLGVPLYQSYPFMVPPNVITLPTTYEFRIPPLWKRLCAEIVDFCILLIIKIALLFLFMEGFSIGNAFELYDFELIQKGIEGKVNFPLAFEVVLLEVLHRAVVCAYEGYYLQGGACATPGKRLMGLMVVHVELLTTIPNGPVETVLATGVSVPGLQRAFLRAIMKNLIVGLLLPLCFTLYVFPHNRTSYDFMTNTVVVESQPEFVIYQTLIGR